MKCFTTLLAIASLATSVLSGVVPPSNAGNLVTVEVGLPEFRQVEPLASSELVERGVPIGCLANVFALLRINRNNRRDIQADLDAHRSIEWNPTVSVTARLDFTNITPSHRYVNFAITNRSQFISTAVIFSNYQDTRANTPVRETVRISVPRARGVAIGTPAPSTFTGCVELPRLDGTWYVQLER